MRTAAQAKRDVGAGGRRATADQPPETSRPSLGVTGLKRTRPTASNRKKKQQLVPPEVVPPKEIEIEEQVGDVEGDDNDSNGDEEGESDDSNGDEQGGSDKDSESEDNEDGEDGKEAERVETQVAEPQPDQISEYALESPPLLTTFQSHVANFIWRGEERGVLKCHCHITKLLAWEISSEVETRGCRSHFKKARLLGIRHFSYKNTNKNLISAFVERWHPETNSFHFPFGEMTITLDDVQCITGLAIEGKTVQSSRKNGPPSIEEIQTLLGIEEEEIDDAVYGVNGSSIKLEWMRKTHMDTLNSVSVKDEAAQISARAYILYTFGCSLFADKTGTRVSTSLLEYLEDFNGIHEYAWGAATLAYLYRQLGCASRSKVMQVSGYLTLLEAWIYEHFPTLVRPPQNMDFVVGRPLSSRWAPEGHSGPDFQRLQAFREKLDSMEKHEVNWNPFAKLRDHYPLNDITYFHGCISCGDIVEPYMPDRVLRQYGYVQTVPSAPLVDRVEKGGYTSKKMKLLWNSLAHYWHTADMHLLSTERLGVHAMLPWECTDEYSIWFSANSHVYVINPYIGRRGTQEPGPSSDAWLMISVAQGMMVPLVERWRSGDCPTVEEFATTMESACRTLQGPNQVESSTSTGRGRGRGKGRGRGRGRAGRT